MTTRAGIALDAPVVMIVDDQSDVVEALRLLLKAEGFRILTANSPDTAVTQAAQHVVDAALVDLNYTRDTTSGREGLDLLSRLRAHDSTVPVIVMTAWGSVDKAVEAMRLGARDFIEKPWDNTRLLATLRTQIELARALRAASRLEQENRMLRMEGAPEMIAESPSMRPVLDVMRRIAPSDANVLVSGDHGTGKEVVARWLHAASNRSTKPLVIVNAGGLPEGVFESELFGHVKGAFTDAKTDRIGRFEMADSGTLFLDEIANIGLAQQARLLRVLQTGELERVGSSQTRRVDVRVIAATNANLAAEVSSGRFREDLLFRLNTIEIKLPRLRDRREDIQPLAAHFLDHYAHRYRRPRTGFSADAVEAMNQYEWPGNVRELAHAVERAVLLSHGQLVEEWDLSLARPNSDGSGPRRPQSLDEMERDAIRDALRRSDGNVSLAAKTLGVSRSALYRRLQRYGITAS